MSNDTLDNEDLEAVLRGDDMVAASFLRLLPHPADVVESLRVVEVREWPRLLRLVGDEAERAEAVALLEEGERSKLLEMLPPEEIGRLVKNLETDDAADLVEELDPPDRREALQSLRPEERATVEDLLQYAPDTAGGLMQVERAQVKQNATVADAVQRVRLLVDDEISVHVVYVVDDQERLVGIVELSKLLLNRSDRRVSEFMDPPMAKTTPDVDQEHVAMLFKKYAMVSLPVVDKEGVMLGRILHDDVMHVVLEEAEEDALKTAGTSAEELLYRDRIFPIARIRLPWLIINMFGSLVSATLLYWYNNVFREALMLASFIPVITAMGGNVGTQSATILTRGLATGRTNLADIPSIVFREFRVGLLMGLVCGTGVGLISAFGFSDGKPVLGLVVFISMVVAMTVAASVGAFAPAFMKRVGIDPAIAAGPVVTTANDSIGIVIYMSTAMLFLDQLK